MLQVDFKPLTDRLSDRLLRDSCQSAAAAAKVHTKVHMLMEFQTIFVKEILYDISRFSYM